MSKVDWGDVKRIVKPVRGLFGDLGGIPTTKTYRVPIKILDTDGKYREYDLKAAQDEREIMSQGLRLRRVYEMTLPRISDKNFDEVFEVVRENSKRLPSLKRAENLLNRHIQRLYRYLQRLTATKKLTAEQVETQIKKAYDVIGYYQQFGDAISAVTEMIEMDTKDADKIADEIQQIKFGERLRQARKAKKKTVRELAADMGIGYSDVTKFELGRKSPSLRTLIKFLENLDVSADWLVLGKTE